MNAKLSFTNLLGHSCSVFYNGNHCAYLSNRDGGELTMNPKDWEFQWCVGLDEQIPVTSEQIISEFIDRRQSEWSKETSKMDDGWTQWDSLDVESWEETNRERLADALKPFGLKITFEDLAESKSSWFKIVKE